MADDRQLIRVGGSFAPPLTDKNLSAYRDLAAAAPAQIGEAMTRLADMVAGYRAVPPTVAGVEPHPSGVGSIRKLAEDTVKRIWDLVPWKEELDMMAGLFDRLDPVTQKAIRDAAYHLLWYAYELFLDREPITKDKIGA